MSKAAMRVTLKAILRAHEAERHSEVSEMLTELIGSLEDTRRPRAEVAKTGAQRTAEWRERRVTKTSQSDVTVTSPASPADSAISLSDPALSSEQSGEETEIQSLSPSRLRSVSERCAREAVTRDASDANEKKVRARHVTRATDDGADDRRAAWTAYACAYRSRYGIDPVRNAKLNGQLKQLCARIPIADLVSTITHYVRSQNARYVGAGHSVGCLLQDAEKLRTEALTGRQGTAAGARRVDHQADRGDQYAEMFERLRAEDEADERAALTAKGA